MSIDKSIRILYDNTNNITEHSKTIVMDQKKPIKRRSSKRDKLEEEQRKNREFREGAMRLQESLAAEERFFRDARWNETMRESL
jgi:uncharacterized protein YcbK (DUF882 family)